jgi:hypothetical protein
MEMLSNSVSMVLQLRKPINLKAPEVGDDTFSETSVRISSTRYEVPEATLFDTAVKASQKTVLFDHQRFFYL